MNLWLLVNTQIRVAPNGRLIGLDYVAVERTAKIHDINLTPGVMLKIQRLESDFLKEVNKVGQQ